MIGAVRPSVRSPSFSAAHAVMTTRGFGRRGPTLVMPNGSSSSSVSNRLLTNATASEGVLTRRRHSGRSRATRFSRPRRHSRDHAKRNGVSVQPALHVYRNCRVSDRVAQSQSVGVCTDQPKCRLAISLAVLATAGPRRSADRRSPTRSVAQLERSARPTTRSTGLLPRLRSPPLSSSVGPPRRE